MIRPQPDRTRLAGNELDQPVRPGELVEMEGDGGTFGSRLDLFHTGGDAQPLDRNDLQQLADLVGQRVRVAEDPRVLWLD